MSQPYKCPVCDGTGKVSRPPHIAGDQETWTASRTGPYPCNACAGAGVLWGPPHEPRVPAPGSPSPSPFVPPGRDGTGTNPDGWTIWTSEQVGPPIFWGSSYVYVSPATAVAPAASYCNLAGCTGGCGICTN